MYLPEQFRETRSEVLHEFIRRHPLATLVCTTAEGITANHIPLVLGQGGDSTVLLHGHVARGNSVWKSVAPDSPVLVIFGGANHYLTPTWYPSKQEHGKVVPTWNYSVVHAHGTIRFEDNREQTLQCVTELTDSQEQGRADRWRVTDAPPGYIDASVKAIVGFQIRVNSLVGKFKASQHRPQDERDSVRQALETQGVTSEDRAELIREPKAR
jgi:transcriptional regulator